MIKYILFTALVLVSACGPKPSQTVSEAGAYQLASQQEEVVLFRMLDAVNALRAARREAPLRLDASLNAAAKTHAFDMSVQNRPWHFGSDGSSPLLRAQRAGYFGTFWGEAISETFETEFVTLAAWMQDAAIREIILNPRARHMGFAWYQEPSGKIWWVLEIGGV